MTNLDNNNEADYMDAMADRLADIDDAIRESEQDEWGGVEEISAEERYACDLYNERNTYPYYD